MDSLRSRIPQRHPAHSGNIPHITALVRIVPGSSGRVIGACIDDAKYPPAIKAIHEDLRVTTERLSLFDNHQAFTLLKNCFSLLKLQYILGLTPVCNHGDELDRFDHTVKQSLTCITNVSMEGTSYTQATLPVKINGLGIRRAEGIVSLASSARCTL